LCINLSKKVLRLLHFRDLLAKHLRLISVCHKNLNWIMLLRNCAIIIQCPQNLSQKHSKIDKQKIIKLLAIFSHVVLSFFSCSDHFLCFSTLTNSNFAICIPTTDHYQRIPQEQCTQFETFLFLNSTNNDRCLIRGEGSQWPTRAANSSAKQRMRMVDQRSRTENCSACKLDNVILVFK
jgi:hypothetical protein